MAESGRWLGTIPTGYSLGEDGRLVPNGQAELVDAVVTTIEEHWMDRRTRDRIRATVRELIETEAPQAEPKQLEKQLATVARKLGKAKQRLLEVDRDMLPIVQDSIRELKARQVQLEAAVKAASLPRGALFRPYKMVALPARNSLN